MMHTTTIHGRFHSGVNPFVVDLVLPPVALDRSIRYSFEWVGFFSSSNPGVLLLDEK